MRPGPTRQALLELLPRCTLVFGNSLEAHAFLQPEEAKEDIPNLRLAQNLAALVSLHGVVVVTDGPNPTIFAQRGECTSEGKEEKAITTTATVCDKPPLVSPSKLVDLNGAGDAFVGGFFAKYLQGDSQHTHKLKEPPHELLVQCVHAGYTCARSVVQVRGVDLPAD